MDQVNQIGKEAKQNKDSSNTPPIGSTLRVFKTAGENLNITDGKWAVVSNLNELMNNSLSKDKIRIKGNVSIAFDMKEIPDLEIEGDLRCKGIASSNLIYVSGDMAGESIKAKVIRATNITSSYVEGDEITVGEKITASELIGGIIKAKEIHVTETLAGDSIVANMIYASDIIAKQIVATEGAGNIEAKNKIICDSLKAKKAKAVKITAETEEITEKKIETGEKIQD
jgi:hypothetical protein